MLIHSLQQPLRELSARADETNIVRRKRADANIDEYFRRTFFPKQQTKSRSKRKVLAIRVSAGRREIQVPFKHLGGDSGLLAIRESFEGKCQIFSHGGQRGQRPQGAGA